ncbi:transmembrane channel-like protein 6 [Aplochiton taeniatus]
MILSRRMYLNQVYRQCVYSCLPLFGSLPLWHEALKRLSGRFGTGVLSYFLFIRTLLVFNIFLLLTNGLFLVLPQAANPHYETRQQRFTAMDLLTGTGYFSETVMFYGYYTNPDTKGCEHSDRADVANRPVWDTGKSCQIMSYNIPLAYFFTIGITFFFTGIILVYSMSKSWGQSSRVFKSHQNWTAKVFCSWDFKVSKQVSVRHQSENISTQLKELLSEGACGGSRRGLLQQLWHFVGHLLAWAVCLASICLCSLVILNLSDYKHLKTKDVEESPVNEVRLLVLPVLVSGLNLLLPGLFKLLSSIEHYDTTTGRVYVAILRNLLLKIGVLGVLCHRWLGQMTTEPESHGLQCWESFVGQEIYRFLLMDFLFTVLYTFCGECLWRVFSRRVSHRHRKPVFDIARNVLELIYGQTLTWLGVLFAPLLPAVQIMKLLVLFYMKKSSLMLNCQASRQPWRASQMTTLFITLLCFPSFLGAAVSVTYTIWTIKPSSSCGPFRNLTTMFQAGRHLALELENTHPSLAWFSRAYTYHVENHFFVYLTAGLFLMALYVYTQVVSGQRRIIALLWEQIENEGMDKAFLITKLQALHEQRHAVSFSK